jgi:hypothetical protein
MAVTRMPSAVASRVACSNETLAFNAVSAAFSLVTSRPTPR